MAARQFSNQRERGAYPPYLFPSVCFTCRKSFKRPPTEATLRCPQCAGALVQLSRKFSAPRSKDREQWSKVQALVSAGFRFQSLYEPIPGGRGGNKVAYPSRLSEVQEFILRYSCLLPRPKLSSPEQ